MTTPCATALFTALLTDEYTPFAPRLKFAIAPFGRGCPTTQLIPAITPANEPDPYLLRTLTEIKLAFFAIPYNFPPTVPEKVKNGSDIEYNGKYLVAEDQTYRQRVFRVHGRRYRPRPENLPQSWLAHQSQYAANKYQCQEYTR
jgi:hypothetical protein